MRSPMRWLCLGLVACCALLVQVIRYQAAELDKVRDRAERHQTALADVQSELENFRVEVGVRNVLEAHDLNVPRYRQRQISQSILEVSKHYDIEPELILAVIFTESRFDVYAESSKGAVGLMQLMPSTALAVAKELELQWKGRQLLTDPEINILLGTSYLRYLMQRYDEQGLDYALAAYNMGPNRLRSLVRQRGQPPARYAEAVRQVTEALRRQYF